MILKRAVDGCACGLMLALCWAALALAAAAQTPDTITKEERDFLTNYMRESQQKLFKEISVLSDAQMKFKPSANAWSVFEIVEHLAKGEDVIFKLVTDTILKAPAQPELKGEKGPRIKDLAIVMYMTNRAANKLQAPEALQPAGKFASKTEIIASLEKLRARNIAYIETTQEDLRGHFRENGIGVIDSYQWLLVLAGHTERHTEQIAEVKAHPGFPKQ